MNDDIVTRLRDGIKACFCHDALDDYECDICPLHTEVADEIERLRNQLADALDVTHSMVIQYCKDHQFGGLWSSFLGAPSDAMRLLNQHGLLQGFDDRGPRLVVADEPDDAEYKRVEACIKQIREGING
jgi:hypothetical protein